MLSALHKTGAPHFAMALGSVDVSGCGMQEEKIGHLCPTVSLQTLTSAKVSTDGSEEALSESYCPF